MVDDESISGAASHVYLRAIGGIKVQDEHEGASFTIVEPNEHVAANDDVPFHNNLTNLHFSHLYWPAITRSRPLLLG